MVGRVMMKWVVRIISRFTKKINHEKKTAKKKKK